MTTAAHPGAQRPGPALPSLPPEAAGPAPPTEIPDPLPKTLPGVVRPQWVRCGRPGCRCARGRPHGPYFYRFWREGGRLRKAYVRPADLAARYHCRRRGSSSVRSGPRPAFYPPSPSARQPPGR